MLIEKKRILVIGDLMLDKYYEGTVGRISPEAPVPVFKKMSERCVPGGAANVAVNLAAAGQDAFAIGICGEDENGNILIRLLQESGVNSDAIIRLPTATITKTRIVANHNQQLLRMDEEDVKCISDETEDRLNFLISEYISSFDIIILADYRKGLLTYSFTQSIIREVLKNKKKIIVDAKDPEIKKYRGGDEPD